MVVQMLSRNVALKSVAVCPICASLRKKISNQLLTVMYSVEFSATVTFSHMLYNMHSGVATGVTPCSGWNLRETIEK